MSRDDGKDCNGSADDVVQDLQISNKLNKKMKEDQK